MSLRGLCLALLFVGDVAAAATAAELPVKDFWRHSEFEQIRISPDGKYLAATVPDEETRALVIFTRKDRKVTGVARFTDKRQVGAFAWVNNDRVAFTMKDAGKGDLVEAFYLQPGEAHGFYKVENNVKLYDPFLSFFDRHIGAKAKAPEAAGL